MIDTNELKRLMDFYTQYGPQPLVTGPGGDSTSEWNAKLQRNNAFKFAMMQPQFQSQAQPDYFALADKYAANGPQGPSMGVMGNYLARLVGGSYGR